MGRAFQRLLPCFIGALLVPIFPFVSANMHEAMDKAMSFQKEQLQRMSDFLGPPELHEDFEPASAQTLRKRQSTITFSNPKAQEFLVDGTTLPDGAVFP
jgi:hypothetical protein